MMKKEKIVKAQDKLINQSKLNQKNSYEIKLFFNLIQSAQTFPKKETKKVETMIEKFSYDFLSFDLKAKKVSMTIQDDYSDGLKHKNYSFPYARYDLNVINNIKKKKNSTIICTND